MISHDAERQARRERTKFACLAGAIILIWGTILTSLAYGTNVTGVTSTTVTGNVAVGGDVIYKGGIGGLPSGSILMYTTACPAGWTRLSAYDNYYVRIAATAGTTGGASSHTPTFSHSHGVSGLSVASGGGWHDHPMTGGSSAAGSHMHVPGSGGSACTYDGTYGFWTTSESSSSDGSHSHTFTIYSDTASDTHSDHSLSGSSSDTLPTIGAGNNNPSYISVVLCKKN